jgi:photosystem II stability/assembly factor-like uncharacterized protein
MAEETLRRSLDRAFDPGPDFPDRLLLSRTMAALETTATHLPRREQFRWSPRAMTLVATALVAVLLLAAGGAFLAINDFTDHPAPAGGTHARPGTAVRGVGGLSVFSAEDAAVLDPSGLLITHDGGKTWLPSEVQTDPSIDSMSWTTPKQIALIDTNSIHVTTDGGISWRQVARPFPSNPGQLGFGIVPTLRVSGSTIFWIPDMDRPNPLTVSRDYGTTWTTAVLPAPPGGWPVGIWFEYAGPTMFGDRGVFAMSSFAMPTTLVYTTSDGGQSWSGPLLEVGGSFVAVNPDEWLIVDRGGKVVRTMDAGKTWDAMTINPHYRNLTLASVFPAVGNVIWGIAVADPNFAAVSGIPIRSTDGGVHWSVVKLPAAFVG